MRTIQQQVAEAANVSITTVSLVLNNKGSISSETKQRVYEAVKATGYRRRSCGGNLAMITGSDNLSLIPNLHQAAAELGYAVSCFKWSRELNEMPPLSAHKKISGVLCYGGTWKHSFLEQLCERYPVVLLGTSVPNENVDSVWVDSLGSVESAVSYLIANGHQHVGLVNGPKASMTSGEKRLGFRQALMYARVPIQGTVVEAEDFTLHYGSIATQELFALDPKISGIVAGETILGEAVYNVCKERDLRIPEDISVIVFRDDERLMEWVPRPSAIKLPEMDLARAAISQLVQRINVPLSSGRRILIKSKLVERESVVPFRV